MRARLQRSLLATLALSRGVPMVGHGDEISRTQLGNNNAYCQDGPISWLSWEPAEDEDLRPFWKRLFALRRELADVLEEQARTSSWLTPSGRPMSPEDWRAPGLQAFGWRLGPALLLFNASAETVTFQIFEVEGRRWEIALESAASTDSGGMGSLGRTAGSAVAVPDHGLTVLVLWA